MPSLTIICRSRLGPMNHDVCELVSSSKLVSASYVAQGRAALNARGKLVQSLISNRRLPATGWDEASIEMLLQVRSHAGGIKTNPRHSQTGVCCHG